MEELNRNIQRIVDNLNDRKTQGQNFSRREAFKSYDKPKMRPLTNGHFVPCEYRYFAKVPNNYHDYIYFYNNERIQTKTGVAPLTLRHSA